MTSPTSQAAAAPKPPPGPDKSAAVAEVRRAVRGMLRRLDLPADALVLAAVSGGADSTALVAALAAEAPLVGLRAGAVTVDHGLQAGSAERADAVARMCRDRGLDPVVVEPAEVDPTAGDGPEAAARDARYLALDAVADRVGAAAVLLGHTLDDQAETVLLGLARGSGARSLSGMPAVRGRYARPLLAVRRSTTLAACHHLQLPVWDDPHNVDPTFTRVRVRHDVLPVLEAALGPGVAEALARSADLLREDADALDVAAADVLHRVGTDRPGGVPVAELSGVPAAVRRRVIREAALAAGVPAGRLTAAHLRDVDRLIGDWRGQGPVRLPGGIDALRSRGDRCDTLVFR